MTKLTYGWVPLAELMVHGLLDLTQAHWQEIALDKDSVPLDIDWKRYFDAERAGLWRVFAAQEEETKQLAGYISWGVGPHVRYKNTTYCIADVFYLAPQYRKGSTGYRLFKEAFAALPRPSKIIVSEKLHFKDGRVGKLLERLGLRPIEKVYSMTLLS